MVIDAHYDTGIHIIKRGSPNHHLFGARDNMLRRLFIATKMTRALKHHVDAQFLPR